MVKEENMKTWLLTWNPRLYSWDELKKEYESGSLVWKCSSSKPQKDDLFFIMALGQSRQKGIFCSGIVDHIELNVPNNDGTNQTANYLHGKETDLLNPYEEKILDLQTLENKFPEQWWLPNASGISIKEEYVLDLVKMWNLHRENPVTIHDGVLPFDDLGIPRAGGRLIPPAAEGEVSGEFPLEKHLEEFLVTNWERLPFGKDYKMKGRQYKTDTGIIDILAISKDEKTFAVIELKRGTPGYEVVGQILSYMGYVKKALADEGQDVKGIIIAYDDDQNIKSALSMVQKVDFYKYQLDFKLDKS